MKMNTRVAVGVAIAIIGGSMVSASAAVDNDAIKAAFSKAPGAEMPYIANTLVAKAKKVDKAETAMVSCALLLPGNRPFVFLW